MKILVVSDSHGQVGNLAEMADREKPFDYLIHCGDGVHDLGNIGIRPGLATLAVSGNMDLGKPGDYKRSIVHGIGGWTFLITHGDMFRVHNGNESLIEEARMCECDIAVFGHTHRPYLSGEKPVLFNPGPAVNGYYGVILLDEAIKCIHKRLG